nr:MAG TPA: hypothetical protein [Caudoviricetes sp.]
MRHYTPLLLLGAILLLGACNPKEPSKQKQQILDPTTKLYINVRNNTMKVTNATDTTTTDDPIPTPREVVERAGCFLLSDPKRSLFDRPLGIADEWKDLDNERIIMSGEKIITDQDRKERGDYHLNDFFLRVRDVRILGVLRDGETEQPIIAYIPNKRMEEAEIAITTAYKEGRYDDVYRLFQELYTAIPTTTARWNELKAKGEQ